MFFGEFTHKVNAKNQVNVPVKLREQIDEEKDGKTLFLMKRPGLCIYAYTLRELAKVIEKLAQDTNAKEASFRRRLAASITPAELDNQGRILLPAELQEAVGISAEVVFVGNVSRIELWPPEKWREFETASEPEFKEKLDKFADDLLEF